MSRLTRDGTTEPVSRDQILRHARGQGNVHFPCSADHEQDWQPYPVDPYSELYVMTIHTYYTRHYTVDPKLPPLGNPFKYHVEEDLSLQPIYEITVVHYYYIVFGCRTTLFLFCFCCFSVVPACVCVCVFSSHSFWTSSSLDVPAGVTQEEGHRIFNPPSFCGACLDFCREKDSAIPFPRRP